MRHGHGRRPDSRGWTPVQQGHDDHHGTDDGEDRDPQPVADRPHLTPGTARVAGTAIPPTGPRGFDCDPSHRLPPCCSARQRRRGRRNRCRRSGRGVRGPSQAIHRCKGNYGFSAAANAFACRSLKPPLTGERPVWLLQLTALDGFVAHPYRELTPRIVLRDAGGGGSRGQDRPATRRLRRGRTEGCTPCEPRRCGCSPSRAG